MKIEWLALGLLLLALVGAIWNSITQLITRPTADYSRVTADNNAVTEVNTRAPEANTASLLGAQATVEASTDRLQPATRQKRSIRFCGDCGYELARDNDGACPMCARFEQLRVDLAAHRAGTLDTNVSVGAEDFASHRPAR